MKPFFCAALLALAAAGAPAQEATPPSGTPEPKVQRTVIEDDAVRIEELKVRGQAQRIVVRPKKGPVSGPYEVIPMDGARDASQGGAKGAAGQRVWHVMTF